MQTYTNHFANLQPPLSPNEEEVELYRKFCDGKEKVLLLGYTKELIALCSVAVDLNPPEGVNAKVKKGNWFDISEQFDCIIGDGVLNLVGGDLITHLQTLSPNICIRFFTQKLPSMKYATIFSSNLKILLPTSITKTQDKCVMLTWNFGD